MIWIHNDFETQSCSDIIIEDFHDSFKSTKIIIDADHGS